MPILDIVLIINGSLIFAFGQCSVVSDARAELEEDQCSHNILLQPLLPVSLAEAAGDSVLNDALKGRSAGHIFYQDSYSR